MLLLWMSTKPHSVGKCEVMCVLYVVSFCGEAEGGGGVRVCSSKLKLSFSFFFNHYSVIIAMC